MFVLVLRTTFICPMEHWPMAHPIWPGLSKTSQGLLGAELHP
jgi:hypothetical protein